MLSDNYSSVIPSNTFKVIECHLRVYVIRNRFPVPCFSNHIKRIKSTELDMQFAGKKMKIYLHFGNFDVKYTRKCQCKTTNVSAMIILF